MNQRGHILASVIVVTAVLLVAGTATLQLVRSQLHANADAVGLQKAFYVADAGIQRGMAQLDQDRTTAIASTSYTQTIDESFGEGSYSVSIAQDPIYPSDPARKRIASTGTVYGVQSNTVAHVIVQDAQPCAICFSDTGTCRIVSTITAGSSLFNGLIHSNQDVSLSVTAGLAINGYGTVRAGRDLITNSALAVALMSMNANAFYQRNAVRWGTHADLLGIPTLGIHFNNGSGKHGVQQAVASRTFPKPSYDRIVRDPDTVIINADNPPPFGTWDATSGTWEYMGTLVFPTSPDVTYYVDGNARLGTILLSGNTNAKIVTRGWLAFQSLNLVTGAITLGVNVNLAAGPVGAAASTITTVGSGSVQNLQLVGEQQVAIGLPVLSLLPVTFDSENSAIANGALGIGLNVASVGATDTNVTAYSESSTVWAKIAAVNALSRPRVSLTAKSDATLAYAGSIASDVVCPF